MEKGVLFYYDKNKNKIPVCTTADCDSLLNSVKRNQMITINYIDGHKDKTIKFMDQFKQKKLYLMYQGTAFLVKDDSKYSSN